MDRLNLLKLLIFAFIIFKPRINDNIILKDEVTVYKQVTSFVIYLRNNTQLNISYIIK